ncbi:MAG: UDP-N-acetylmuramyl-tripeptide synthetase [Patescibacteria group bacterium]
MKRLLKKILPKSALSFYHKSLAFLAAWYYGYRSEKLIVIGVTGTKGKSTTSNILWHLLEGAGYHTGLTSTANFKIHNTTWVNSQKMTMVGRFQLQKLLKQMVDAKCQYAVIEVSSEGIKQWRHYGVNFDYAFFLNLSPEHIEAHGGYENYKQAKGKLFAALAKKSKKINGQVVKKIIFANSDDQEAPYYLNFQSEIKITYGQGEPANVRAENVCLEKQGISWQIKDINFYLPQIGLYNIYNAMPAVALGLEIGLTLPQISSILSQFPGMPGRMELISNNRQLNVIVDYCYEPKSLELALTTLKQLYIKPELNNAIIAVSGPTGGGRDSWRRPVMGELLANNCKYSIITTDDPYDDDPSKIADEMIEGLKKQGKIENQDYFKIIDRKSAIKKAIELAKINDVILLAGKGCDPVMAVANGKSIKWDDREVAKELLNM